MKTEAERRADYERIVRDIHEVYRYRNAPDYRDVNGYFSKDWRLWTPEDLKKIDPGAVRSLYGMAQWGYTDLLAQVLPNYYRGRGGCTEFAQDVDTVYHGGTVQAARMGYHADRQPAKPVQLDFRPSPAQGSTTTQASLDALGQLARNAVQLANVTLHPASEVLPVALRGVATLKQVA